MKKINSVKNTFRSHFVLWPKHLRNFFYFFLLGRARAWKWEEKRRLELLLNCGRSGRLLWKLWPIYRCLEGPSSTSWPPHAELRKKFKMKSHDWRSSFLVNLTENFQKLCFFWFCDFNINFFEIMSYIDPSGHFVFYKIFVTNFYNSFFRLTRNFEISI